MREPECDHDRQGIVTSGSPDGPHAATNVCARPECVQDAIYWAYGITRLPATYRPDPGQPYPQPSLFPEAVTR